jgi:hypothetical protein
MQRTELQTEDNRQKSQEPRTESREPRAESREPGQKTLDNSTYNLYDYILYKWI